MEAQFQKDIITYYENNDRTRTDGGLLVEAKLTVSAVTWLLIVQVCIVIDQLSSGVRTRWHVTYYRNNVEFLCCSKYS